jgi:dihydrofolate reductase
MSKLIFFTGMSLDGFIADENDSMEWSRPNDEVYTIINDIHRPIGTYLYGRKNYETMTVWETPEQMPDQTPDMLNFGRIWKAALKIVYSKSLQSVSTSNTRLEHDFDPQAVRELKAQSPHDISVAGPNLGGQAIQAGVVDEIHLLVVPILLGKGKRTLPENAVVKLELLDERRLGNGWVYLRYRTHG